MKKEEEEQGFRITDKRGFREDGEVRTPESSEKAEETADNRADEKPASGQEIPPRPPIDFASYIMGYYAQAMVFLGEVPNPLTNKKEEDVEASRQMIDILSMLEQKTKGNLNSEEQQLLESVLYELRMKFMAKTNRIKY